PSFHWRSSPAAEHRSILGNGWLRFRSRACSTSLSSASPKQNRVGDQLPQEHEGRDGQLFCHDYHHLYPSSIKLRQNQEIPNPATKPTAIPMRVWIQNISYATEL